MSQRHHYLRREALEFSLTSVLSTKGQITQMELPLGLELDLIDGIKMNSNKRNNGRNSPTQVYNAECPRSSETESENERAKVEDSSGGNVRDKAPKESELKQLVEAVFDH